MGRPMRWDRVERRALYLVKVLEDRRFQTISGLNAEALAGLREDLRALAEAAKQIGDAASKPKVEAAAPVTAEKVA